MRLRSRLLLSFTYLLILAVLALAIPLGITVQRRARADLESQLSSQALVIAASLPEVFTRLEPQRQLQQLARAYGDDLDARVIVVGAGARLLADSASARIPEPEDFSNRPEVVRALTGDRVLTTRYSRDLDAELLVVAVPVLRGSRPIGAVRLSETTADVDARVRFSWFAIGLAGLLVIAAGLGIAFGLARALLTPLRALQGTAASLAQGDLSARAPERGPPDIAEVARALNRMATDLEQTITAQLDFVANASHQLRTPLTGLRLRLESMEGGSAREGDATAAIREVDRLNQLVEDLLRLERARAAGATAAAVDLADLARAAAERWSARAAANEQRIEVQAEPARAVGDPDQLAMALDNLIENAIVYSPPGTRISLVTGASEGASFVRVVDRGPGIAPEDLPRVRERFFRGGVGRQTAPGTGLGLAIVDEIASRWGGALELLSSEAGTTATLRLTVS